MHHTLTDSSQENDPIGTLECVDTALAQSWYENFKLTVKMLVYALDYMQSPEMLLVDGISSKEGRVKFPRGTAFQVKGLIFHALSCSLKEDVNV